MQNISETRSAAGLIDVRVPTLQVNGLEAELCARVRGEVRFSNGDRGMWASDAGNYRMIPIGVVLPKDARDVVEAVAVARRYGAPMVARGGGTGIPGQTVNAAVVIDFSKYMNRILDLDPSRKIARVEPGIVLDSLRKAAERHTLTFGPDPATHSRCTLGGMIGNNSCGVHSVMGGETKDNIDELEILLYDGTRMRVGATPPDELQRIIGQGGRRGEIYARLKRLCEKYGDAIRKQFPQIPRRVSGYNLPDLLPENGFHVAHALIGSESTCVLVLEATAKLIYSPPVRSLLVLGYSDIYTAADHVVEPMQFHPTGLEAMDYQIVEDVKKKGLPVPRVDLMPEGKAWLLIEFGGKDKQEADANAQALMDHLKKSANPPPMKLFDDRKQEKAIWDLREEGLGATARIPCEPDNHEGWEDSSVPPEKLGAYLRELRKLLDKYQYQGPFYGHFGQGCVHTRLTFDLETAEGIRKWRAFLGEAADLVVSHGGSLSGEHGDGQARGELLPHMFDATMMEAFREFKSIWDPDGKMNPGKLIDAYRVDENLRLGTSWNPPEPRTHFSYPADQFSFAQATERCVGAGVCRRLDGGTMCPSYMVTREEKHSTRGRARILNEMIRGDVVRDGWKSEDVFEALDLCLSCKGCKGDCPVQVDVATYKAEFLSHYYQGKLRPRTALTMGQIHRWAKLAAYVPHVANLFTQTPVLRDVAKWAAGVHPNRQIPKFAAYTFREWFQKRQSPVVGGSRVILWADTFNNHFHPEKVQAAVEVLEAAGFVVEVPNAHLCCGRLLYDWGMFDQAKRQLVRTLRTVRREIEDGIPIVVLEPSCASVFRDELTNLFPHSEDAKRLREQTLLLSEFLDKKAGQFRLPRLERRALVHGHCHQKALMGMGEEEKVLEKMGVQFEAPDTGCCGMAGAFGFEKHKYEVAMKCGERVLLPAVRKTETETLIVADGFSCHEQIKQAAGRDALHLAQVIQMGLWGGRPAPRDSLRTGWRTAARVVGAVAAGWLIAKAVGRIAGRV
ncbi:MAG TPA: FAD-binding and (Fe-S)-binding domain-containing protein [Bryobacteraceae bacterium]